MTSPDFADYETWCAAVRALEDEILPANKAALFQVLSNAGIRTVVVSFDGCGDSGQIEAVVARDAEGVEVAIPLVDLAVRAVDFRAVAITETATTAGDLIETMAYKLLEQTHDGWETDDGAYGGFTFDVAAQSITLAYSERYTDTHYHEHEF
jgi:hypothetical protein